MLAACENKPNTLEGAVGVKPNTLEGVVGVKPNTLEGVVERCIGLAPQKSLNFPALDVNGLNFELFKFVGNGLSPSFLVSERDDQSQQSRSP